MGIVATMSSFVPSSPSARTSEGVTLEQGQQILRSRDQQLQDEVADIDEQIEKLRSQRRELREEQRRLCGAMYSMDQEVKRLESK